MRVLAAVFLVLSLAVPAAQVGCTKVQAGDVSSLAKLVLADVLAGRSFTDTVGDVSTFLAANPAIGKPTADVATVVFDLIRTLEDEGVIPEAAKAHAEKMRADGIRFTSQRP